MKLNKHNLLYVEDLNHILSIKDIDKLQGKSFLITGATGMVGVMLIDYEKNQAKHENGLNQKKVNRGII